MKNKYIQPKIDIVSLNLANDIVATSEGANEGMCTSVETCLVFDE